MENQTTFKFFVMDVEKSKPVTRDAKVFRKYFVESTLDPQQKRLLSMNMKVKDQDVRTKQQEEIAQIFMPITKDRVSRLMAVNMQPSSQTLTENGGSARKMAQSRDGSTNKEGQPKHTLISNFQIFENKVMNREVEYVDSNKVSARQLEQAFRNRKQIQIKSFSSSSANRENETSMNSNGLIHSIFSQNTLLPLSRVQNTRLSNSVQRDNIDSTQIKLLKNSTSTPSFRRSYEIGDFKSYQSDNQHFSLAKQQIKVYKAKQERRSINREERQSNDFIEEICGNVKDRIDNYQKNSLSGSAKRYPQSDAVSYIQSNKSGYHNILGLKSYSVDNFMNSQGFNAFQTTPNFLQQKVDQQIGTEEFAPLNVLIEAQKQNNPIRLQDQEQDKHSAFNDDLLQEQYSCYPNTYKTRIIPSSLNIYSKQRKIESQNIKERSPQPKQNIVKTMKQLKWNKDEKQRLKNMQVIVRSYKYLDRVENSQISKNAPQSSMVEIRKSVVAQEKKTQQEESMSPPKQPQEQTMSPPKQHRYIFRNYSNQGIPQVNIAQRLNIFGKTLSKPIKSRQDYTYQKEDQTKTSDQAANTSFQPLDFSH